MLKVSLSAKALIAGVVLATATAFANATPASAQTIVTIQQVSNNRYVDAHEYAGEDYRIVTRPAQNNDTQKWRMIHVAGQIYMFQQVSSGRYMDAHEYEGEDYRLVTRPAQNNATQQWLVISQGNNVYTIQQVSNGRYVDAHENADQDYRLVTRPAQNNATQQWRITPVFDIVLPPPVPPIPPVLSSGSFQLIPTARVDVDNGNLGFAGADLVYQAAGLTDLEIAPINGARIHFTNNVQSGFLGCLNQTYSTNPVPYSSLVAGGYMCVLTSDGRFSQLRFDNIGPILRVLSISYTTWQQP